MQLCIGETAVSPKYCCLFDCKHTDFDHITPVLRDLHWFPVAQRIIFKTAMLVFKCLRGLAPSYLNEFCWPVSTVSGRRQLRSGTTGILHVPRRKTSIGSRSFAVASPVTWNSLPAELRTLELSLLSFAKRLKTLSLQQLLTVACSAFVVTSFLVRAVYKIPYYCY